MARKQVALGGLLAAVLLMTFHVGASHGARPLEAGSAMRRLHRRGGSDDNSQAAGGTATSFLPGGSNGGGGGFVGGGGGGIVGGGGFVNGGGGAFAGGVGFPRGGVAGGGFVNGGGAFVGGGFPRGGFVGGGFRGGVVGGFPGGVVVGGFQPQGTFTRTETIPGVGTVTGTVSNVGGQATASFGGTTTINGVTVSKTFTNAGGISNGVVTVTGRRRRATS